MKGLTSKEKRDAKVPRLGPVPSGGGRAATWAFPSSLLINDRLGGGPARCQPLCLPLANRPAAAGWGLQPCGFSPTEVFYFLGGGGTL